jgi:hypothetical protein
MSTTETSAVEDIVLSAFRGVSAPHKSDFLRPGCIDNFEILPFLNIETEWQNIPENLIAGNSSGLFFLSSVAFRFIFPRYLLFCCQSSNHDSFNSHTVTDLISKIGTEQGDDFFKDFSCKQISACQYIGSHINSMCNSTK